MIISTCGALYSLRGSLQDLGDLRRAGSHHHQDPPGPHWSRGVSAVLPNARVETCHLILKTPLVF